MEKMNFGPSPENEKPTPPPVELKKRKKFNPDDRTPYVEVDRNTLPSGEPEIAELESLFAEFEARFSLEELYAITTLSKEDGHYKHPVRDAAKKVIGKITEMVHTLEEETNTPSEKLREYTQRFRVLSHAIGIVDKDGIIDRTR